MRNTPAERTATSPLSVWTGLVREPWLLALALVIITFVAYLPAMRGGFIWDDDDHLTANPAVAAPNGLRYIWSSLTISRYYPLTLTNFWIQRRLWGLNPMPYHAVNIAFHAANGVVIFFLLRRLRIRAAWFAAALWALHPVNVESVAWITELKNTQSGLFFFLSVLCFVRFDERKRYRWQISAFWYALAFVFGTAAMLSKTSTVVLPLALLLCAWWQRGRLGQTDALNSAPFFGLAWLMSGLTIVEQHGQIAHKATAEWSMRIPDRLIVAGKAIWFYVGKIMWPVDLAFIYPRWDVAAHSVWSWLPLAGVVAACVVLWVWRQQTWAQAAFFGLGFFATALLPALSFFDVYFFRFSFVADHFQYLASLGVIALTANGIAYALGRWRQWLTPAGNVVCVALLATLGCLTWKQTHPYHDIETLWRDTLAKNPSAWMAHYNLGVALEHAGAMPEAIEQWEQALHYKPDYAEAHYNLGLALGQAGQTDEARGHWELALQARPDLVGAQNGLARLLATLPVADGGDPARAVELAQQACRATGDQVAAYLDTLAAAYAAAGQFNEAIAKAREASDLACAIRQPGLAEEIEARLQLYRDGLTSLPEGDTKRPHTP